MISYVIHEVMKKTKHICLPFTVVYIPKIHLLYITFDIPLCVLMPYLTNDLGALRYTPIRHIHCRRPKSVYIESQICNIKHIEWKLCGNSNGIIKYFSDKCQNMQTPLYVFKPAKFNIWPPQTFNIV